MTNHCIKRYYEIFKIPKQTLPLASAAVCIFRQAIIIFAPFFAINFAVSFPIPQFAPVIITVLFSRPETFKLSKVKNK
jgi:hypothetical protein